MKRVLGIDPGLHGAAAVVEIAAAKSFNLLDVIDIPIMGEDARRRVDAIQLAGWLHRHRVDHAVIERVSLHPDQNVASGGIFMRAVGYLECAVLLSNVPLSSLEARPWKHHFGLIKAEKEAARLVAIHVFGPAAEDRWFSRKKDHNRAEAALIARYAAEKIFAGNYGGK